MQLSMRSVLATGAAAATATAIAFAPPPPAASLPVHVAAPVALAGAWQDLGANVSEDLANLSALIVANASTPILTQLASNFTTYGQWLAGQDGGSPAKVVKTIGEHLANVGATLSSYLFLVPLSFVGSFIAPGVMIVQLIADTAKYPSTPQTVVQAFIDAPAVFLNTALNCCSTQLFNLSFGLLNPGPLGYLLQVRSAIAAALKIATPSSPEPSASVTKPTAESVEPASSSPAPAVGLTRRAPSDTGAQKTARGATRPSAARKVADDARETASPTGTGQSARGVRPASPGTR